MIMKKWKPIEQRPERRERFGDAGEEVRLSGGASRRDPRDVVPARDDADRVRLRETRIDRRSEPARDAQRREGKREVSLVRPLRRLDAL